MKLMRTHQALGYSTFGAIIFNFGSILFWMFSKAYLPENSLLLIHYGVLSGALLLYTTKTYFDNVDSKTIQPEDNTE